MKTELSHYTLCDCGEDHSGSCSQRADEFLVKQTDTYLYTRRAILRNALIGGTALASLSLFPIEARADIFTPSAAEQKKAGDEAGQQILQKYHEVTDSRARHFDGVGNRLVDALKPKDRGPWDYRFHVIDSKEINAFAVPGGNMFMFTGLLDRIKSDDELAAVTGHEMTHVRKQHWAKAVSSRMKTELGLEVILGLAHAGSGWRQLAGGVDTLYSLRFSRKEEDEADAGGLQNMVQAHFDPQGMLDLFHTLQTASGNRGEPPAFLSDHPLTKDRIKNTQNRINKLHR